MKYEIEWYNPEVGTPIVSLAEYGLVFNKAASELLGNPNKIKLGFDKKNLIIAVASADNDDSSALQFYGKERKGFTRINCKDFVRFITRYFPDINLVKAIRFLARMDKEEGILVVDLKKPIDAEDSLKIGE
ncbi:MAG: hypothetical protein AB1374_08985 [Bacillota bacterium]